MQSSLTRFDLNLLLALDALLTERHVTRAAERLYVSQPAMSGMLQRLREQFDDQLLVRVGREMEITPKGQALRARMHDLLTDMRELLEAEPHFDPFTAKRSFRVVMSDYCASVFLPRLTRVLSETAPYIQVWTENVGADSYERLLNGDVDLCISTDEGQLMSHGRAYDFKSALLFSDDYVCVLWQDHPSVHQELSLELFKASRHAMTKFASSTMTIEENAFQQAGVTVEARVLIPSFSNLFRLLPETDLIATVQRRLADLYIPMLPLKILSPPVPIPRLQEAMVWHSRSELDPAHAWLRLVCAEVATKLD